MSDRDAPGMEDRLRDLRARKARAVEMGGAERVERHHASGRLAVRERIDALIDPGSWFEIGLLGLPERRIERPVPGDGVATGFAELDGRPVALVGIDATVLAGTTAPISMRKQGRVIDMAVRKGMPIVVLADADGGRIPDVMGWRFSGLPFDFRSFLKVPEGVAPVPRATAVLGPSYGDAALHAASSHFVVMTETASLALSGPSVIKAAVGEEVDDDTLGGPAAALAAGNAHLVVDSEEDAFAALRFFFSYLPPNASEAAPVTEAAEPATDPAELERLVPTRRRRGYNMEQVLEAVCDAGSLFVLRREGAPSVITALARVAGNPVGVVASQPMHLGGVLDPAALEKEHDFVDFCDTFNLPLVFFHDVPGLMIGTAAEGDGVLRWYEKLAARIALATVPKIGFVVRKAYGGGHYAMGGRPTVPDFLFAWPTAELGFMAPEPGIRTVYRRRLDAAESEGGTEAREELFNELVREWEDESEPWEAAAHLFVDDVIEPGETRGVLIRALDIAWGSGPRVARTRW
jgi:acetyl-CoA carboxylase carboxyltransferase component